MSRDWKPGDVAMVRLDSETEIRAMFHGGSWIGRKGTFYDPHLSARPLVVIDPEKIPHLREFGTDPRQALLTLAQDVFEADQHFSCDLDAAAAVLRWLAEQMPLPPKPDEPTDPAARVWANGCEWAKVGSWWVTPGVGEHPREWDYLVDAVGFHILHEAVDA